MPVFTKPSELVNRITKTLTALLLIIFFSSVCCAQKPLTNSRQNSYCTYIYKLNPEDVLKFYKFPGKDPDEKILKNPIDSFKTDKYWENNLPAGNYLKVYAEKNRLQYKLIENHSAFIKLLSNKYDHRFAFVDRLGSETPDAVVRFNNKHVWFDDKSKTWHVRHSKKTNIVQADYAGTANFFVVKEQGYNKDNDDDITWFSKLLAPIKKIFVKKESNRYRNVYNYFRFMIFNKPTYKPRDTVKFKAFILKAKSGEPIVEKQLLVKIKQGYHKDARTIGTVRSYRDGGFEYNFVLNDSLKLTLDDNVTIYLEDPNVSKPSKNKHYRYCFDDGHLIFAQGSFDYQDYELKSIHFDARIDKKDHQPGDSPAIYLKATDENDLPVPDGRVTLTLTTDNVKDYQTRHAYVPDTLWIHKAQLDPVGETKIIIPDSIFPKADVDYRINADFLNSSNEHQSKNINASFHYERYNIITELNGDTLKATYREFGKEIKASAYISALNGNDDTISKVKVMLPSKTIINPIAATYEVETDSTLTDLALKDSDDGISLSGYRTADSLFVTVNNSRSLRFWYSVFAGNKLIDAGQADRLFYKRAYNEQKIITFLVNYIWGGESKFKQAITVYRDDQLNINVKQPVSVYPGQQLQTDIVVTDVNGEPVANTDLTAWSITRKFSYYNAPSAPYIGRSYPSRKTRIDFETDDPETKGNIKLNWSRWGHEIGLDSIAYYKFTNTKNIYQVEESGVDTVTQIAPFIVKNGDIVPVHILYVDEKPVYFSQAQQLQQYSFMITPGIHSLRFRTSNQNIKLDSVCVDRGKKLIMSINADYALSTKVSDTLSYYEADALNKYMITMIDNFDQKKALIRQGDHIFFLNSQPGQRSKILTGPLSTNYTIFDLQGEKQRLFVAEHGYSYLFGYDLLKQTSILTPYPFNRVLSSSPGIDDYTQYAVTETRADSIWQQYLDLRSNSQQLFGNDPITEKQTGRLIIERKTNKNEVQLLIKNIIVYRYDDPDFIRFFPGNTTDFGYLAQGKYRMFFLLKGDKYDIKENIGIKPYGINFYKIPVTPTHPADSVGIKISRIIDSRPEMYISSDYSIENDALRIKEVFNEKYLNTSDFAGSISGEIVDKDGKSALIGVSIRVKGTSVRTVSDINGHFTINVPARGKLIINYIGFETREVDIELGKTIIISLEPSHQFLREVVVVGYGSQSRRDMTGSVSSVTSEQLLMGRSSGLSVTAAAAPGSGSKILIRGVASTGAGEPLYIVDGEVVKNLSEVEPSAISEMSLLKDAAATALYGIRAANGVVIITTKKKAATLQLAGNSLQPGDQSIRKNFSDYAYWQPKLTTDANGKASFTTTFPDDITNWRTFVIGINDQKQSGYVEHQIKSFKPLSANFIAPLFAVQGDELSTIGKVMNYNSDAIKVTRSFTYNGKLFKRDNFEVKNAKIDTFKVITPNTDSLTFEYSIKRDNSYFDGERRKIPVIQQGVKETKGIFEALNTDTTINMKFDPALGAVTFRAEASILPVLAQEAQHLREYKYLCNEQLASKLKGLLAEKRIKKYLGEPFKFERNILEVIKKLQDNRRSQGTWGWWKDTDEELWISLHAVEALTDAQKDGYTIDIDEKKLTDYLVYQLESYKGEEKLACLQLLHKLNAKVDYPKYFGVITKEYAAQKQVARYDRFRLMLLQQEAGLTVKLDSLLDTEQRTLFGNIYWGEDSYRFFDNSIQLGVLAYKIIKSEGKHPELLEKIRGYFLEQRRLGEWRNTYESSLILETILPDQLKDSKQVKPATLIIKGVKTDTVKKFPYTATLTDQQFGISKTGSLPVYITGYQQFWNPQPEKVNKEFAVDTWFEKNNDHLTHLKGGEPVLLKAEVTVKGDADYVMIEIPIPAGCSYESKEQSWQNNEVHCEYFKEKVSIFCRKLKQGKYEFIVNLTPRYDGKYNLNPAKAEMMYFPAFYGREGVKSIIIGQ